jgi:hypothetical protein
MFYLYGLLAYMLGDKTDGEDTELRKWSWKTQQVSLHPQSKKERGLRVINRLNSVIMNLYINSSYEFEEIRTWKTLKVKFQAREKVI